MNKESVDLMRSVLDHEIVDADDVPCGMVDDVELSGGPGARLAVEALLTGPGAWTDRLPWVFPSLVKALVGRHTSRIPWTEVASAGDRIKLKSTAKGLGLNVGDGKLGHWLGRIPGSEAD
jgi:hypothetical protein